MRHTKSRARHIADIIIARRLTPGPAVFFFINAKCLAIEQLAVLHGAIGRRAPQSGNRRGHLFERAVDKFRGFHFTAQMRCRQIIAPWIKARIGLWLNRQSALPNNDKPREWLAPRRRPDDRRALSNSMHKYRNAPNRGNYRQSAPETRRR